MKKLLLTFAILPLTAHILFSQVGSWSQKTNFGGNSRSNAVGFGIGSFGYMGTGNTGTAAKDFWKYNPSTNVWTQVADFGGGLRWGAVGIAIGSYGYVGTGLNGSTYYNDWWQYDPSANTWTAKANFPGSGRYYAFGFASNYSGYIGTGANGTQAFNDFYRYNPANNTWTARANFNNARMDAFGFYVNGKGFAGTGRTFGSSPTFYNDFYQYDSTSNAWTAKANFGGSVREGAGAFVIGNNGYAGTGSINNFSTQYTDFYKYNPVANTWTAVATFIGTQRTNAATFSVGNFGYLGTGFTVSATTTTFFQYDMCGLSTTVTPTAPACNGGTNGSIAVSVSNATSPLTYLWSSGSTTSAAVNVNAGNYSVTITDGAGCTKTSTVTVTQPTALTGNVTTITNVSCCGSNNGKATITGSGATPPYTYFWSPSGGNSASATGLSAGSYYCTITDSKGCFSTTTVTITQPSCLTDSFASTSASKACVCNATATVVATGGVSPYTYSWNTGSTTSSVSGICGGAQYTVTVTDANGCTKLNTLLAGGPAALTLTMTATPATCPSCPNGSATANIGGGTSPFTYSWVTTPAQTTQTASGLSPAYYHVCVADADSCVICDSVYVGFSVGVHETFTEENISITPNPSSDGKFTVYSLQFLIGEIEIYNLVGEKIFSSTINRKQETINLNEGCGIYFLKIKFADSVITRKIIVSR